MVDTMDKLGIVIKDARSQAGMTRKETASKLHVTPRHLMSIENGHQKPSFDLLYRLVRELTIPADLIFYPESSPTHMGCERTAAMLHKCNEKEISIIAATLQFILDGKPATENNSVQ